MSQPRFKVLVVDDNPQWVDLLCSVFQNEYEVLHARDGDEALRVVSRTKPDLIFLDVLMPKVTGVEVLRSLQADPSLARSLVVLMTANAFDPKTEAMFRAHPNVRGYLKKPCSLRDALHAAQAVLRSRTATQAPAAASPPPGARPRNLLVADEDAAFFQFIGLAVDGEDLIHRAQDGVEALVLLKRIKPDLLICAMIMPRLSGIELLRVLAADPRLKTVPVILLTATRLPPRQQSLLAKDFPSIRYFFEKPCDAAALKGAFDALLGR